MKQALQNLLAEGKTAKTIQSLLAITKSQDVDLYHEVLQISARFAEYERQKRLGIVEDAPLSIERNKINAALVAVIDKLPDTGESSGDLESSTNAENGSSKKWLKIGAWLVAAIGIIASIAQISGYSLKDFFSKEEKKETVVPHSLPSVEPPKIDKPIAKIPQKTVEKATTNPTSVKNQSNIKVEKGGKVGAIITGDSNKIDLKQDF